MSVWLSIIRAQLMYLDPGSGSFLIQLLMAAVLGLGVAVKIYWSKIKTLFRGSNPDVSAEQHSKDDEDLD